jgi:mono/diheme cytochrome c family protein
MKTTKVFFATMLVACFTIATMMVVYAQAQKGKPWTISQKYKDLKNPVKTSDASIQEGMSQYRKDCAKCHGKEGLGDGPKGKMLETFPGNFTIAEFQAETDGEIFFQSKMGRGEMPSYENKLEDNEIWNIVNYIRTLKK